jgi:superfamily II DNA or RNA helicase
MIELFPYQRDLVAEFYDAVDCGRRRILIVCPTGGGKTIIAGEIIRRRTAEFKRTCFIAHRDELLTQARDKLRKFDIGSGIIKAGRDKDARPQSLVQVCGIQTLYARAIRGDRMELPPADDLWIDECHRARAMTYTKLIEAYPNAVIVGLTATPCRGDGRGLGNIFEVMLQAPQVGELIAQGYLCKLRIFAPPPPDLRGIAISQGDYVINQLSERMNTDVLVGDFILHWLRHAGRRRTVVYAVDIKHSIHLVDEMLKSGIRAEHLDGTTPQAQREAILERLRTGETEVVSNCMVLTEGFDLPDLGCIGICRPTRSLGLFRQMVGRGVRSTEGKRDCVARDTLILTDKGEVKIQDVTTNHRVWDGREFVNHAGAVCKGIQMVITHDGITATPDHEVMTNDGWKRLEEAHRRHLRITRSGFAECPIWIATNHFEKNRRRQLQAAGRSEVRPMFGRSHGSLQQSQKAAEYGSLSILQRQKTSHGAVLAVPTLPRAAEPLSESIGSLLQPIWRTWNRVQIHRPQRSSDLDSRESWNRGSLNATRQDKQRWSLRTEQSALGASCAEREQQHQSSRKPKTIHQFPRTISRNTIRRPHIKWPDQRGAVGQTNCRPMATTIEQTEREVWDILNAGPLQRFTANGRLVHNCVILDHSGGVHRHGRPDDAIEWTLDVDKRASNPRHEARLREFPDNPWTECRECGEQRMRGEACPNCGYMPKPPGRAVDVIDGDLIELGATRKAELDRKLFYLELRGHQLGARKKDGSLYASGWAAQQFKTKFGHFPPWGWNNEAPTEPSIQTRRWIRSRQIAWAKSRSA